MFVCVITPLQVLPLLKQLNDEGNKPSHNSYMLLIILLILSQDECLNKSVHEKVMKCLLAKERMVFLIIIIFICGADLYRRLKVFRGAGKKA